MTVPGTVTSAAMRAQLAADMTEAVLQAQVVAAVLQERAREVTE